MLILPLRPTALDVKGVHPCSCAAGADFTRRHHEIRDCLFAWAARGNLRPELEKAGVTEGGIFEATVRPSDRAIERSSDRASDDRASDRASDRAIDGARKSSSRSPSDTLTSAL